MGETRKKGAFCFAFLLLGAIVSFIIATRGYSENVSLQFQNTEVREILRVVAKKLNVNLIIDKSIDKALEKKVSVEIRDLDAAKAFQTVMQVSGLEMAEVSKGVFFVSSADNIKKMKPLKNQYLALK